MLPHFDRLGLTQIFLLKIAPVVKHFAHAVAEIGKFLQKVTECFAGPKG